MTHQDTHSIDDKEEKAGLGFFSGLMVGGLVGAAIGFLVAPYSGKETLNLLRDKSLEIKDQVEQSARETRDRAEMMAQELRSKAETVVDDTRSKVKETKTKLERTAEAASRAAQEAWTENKPA